MIIEHQLQSVFKYCTDFVYCLEQIEGQYIYRYVNPATSIVFNGKSPIGHTLGEMLNNSPQSKLIHRKYDEALQENKQVIYRDFNLFSSTAMTNETTIIPMLDSNSVLAITKEVSTLKVLEEENYFLSELFEKQNDSILILDKNYKIVKVNKKFEDVFTQNLNVVGMDFENLGVFNTEQKEKVWKALESAKDRKSVHLRFDLNGEADEKLSYIVNISPVLLEDEVVALSIQIQPYTKNSVLRDTLDEKNTILNAYQKALDEGANFCITNYDGVIEYVSSGYLELSHYENSEDLVGLTNAVLNSRQHSRAFYADMWNTIKSGKTWRGEICNRSRIGTQYWVDTTIVPMFNAQGDIQNFLSVCFDVTEKHVMMTNLRNIERTFKLITENTNDFIVITNEDGIVLYVSPNHESRLSYEKESLLGKFYYDVLSDESKVLFRNEVENLLEEESDTQLELQLLTKAGSQVWIEAHVTAVKDSSREEVYQFVIIAREITKRKQKEDELRFMAYHDSLTLLPNRRYLTLEFTKLVKQAINYDHAITLLYIDGDNFKRINDVYGHDVGDLFIREFAQALVKSVREYDIVSRVGGDEFIIMLTHMSLDKELRQKQLLQTIERIQAILRKGWIIEGTHFAPTSSIGIASYPTNGQSINELMAHADEALYIAKKINGKDSFYISDVEVQ